MQGCGLMRPGCNVSVTKIYFPQDKTMQVHQMRVCHYPSSWPAGYYCYGGKRRGPGCLPKWVDQLLPHDPEQTISLEDEMGTNGEADQHGSVAQPDAEDGKSEEDVAPEVEPGEDPDLSVEPEPEAKFQDPRCQLRRNVRPSD